MNEVVYKQLEAWLESPLFKGKAMRADKLQGFLFAVLSGPDMISPRLWIPEALGDAPEYESLQQAQEFLAVLMNFYNDVADSLQSKQPPRLILKRNSSDQPLDYKTWCEGYILGWALSTQEWLQPGNEPLKKLTFPILYLSGAFKEDAERRGKEFVPDEEDQKVWQECADMLPMTVLAIYNFWLSRRKPLPLKREHAKVGRNEACPCGSGKKFKQCCGNDRTLH